MSWDKPLVGYGVTPYDTAEIIEQLISEAMVECRWCDQLFKAEDASMVVCVSCTDWVVRYIKAGANFTVDIP